MPFTPQILLRILVLPAALALLILFVGRRAWKRSDEGQPGKWAGPFAAGVAILVAFPFVMGAFAVTPPKESLGWTFWIAAIAMLAGIVGATGPVPSWLRPIGASIIGVVSAWLMFKFKIGTGENPEYEWSRRHAIGVFAGIGALVAIWWKSLDSAERDPHSNSAGPWILWLLATSTCVLTSMTGGLKQAQFAMPLAGVGGAAILLTILRRRRMFVSGTAIVYATLIPLMLVSIFIVGDDLQPTENRLLIAALCAPAAIVIGRLLPVANRPPWLRVIFRIAPVALLCAVVLFIAAKHFQDAQKAESGEESSSIPSSRAALVA